MILALCIAAVNAQNNISGLRYDDNFSHLKKDSLKKGLERLKYIPIGKYYISVGGELREQLQVFNNINFGDIPPNYPDTKTSQWNHRLMIHADIELGNHVRIFTQTQ